MTERIDKGELRDKVAAVVNSLPQRSVIPDEVAERWIDGIIVRDPMRAVWHAKRAQGIGGSEIGELVLHASGQATTYSTLEEISRQKLLLDLPTPETIHMIRGTAMEPLAQKTYWAISKHQTILDQPSVAQAFQQGHPDHNWLVGNPDDVVVTPNQKRLITDFKVRSNLDSSEDIKLVNACQLHWYGLIHEGRFGAIPDGYALAELDIPNELIDALRSEDTPDFDAMAQTIASVNKPGFGMQIRMFKHNPALADHMTRLAGQFWENHVMSGKVFTTPKPQKPQSMPEADARAIEDKLNKLVRYKMAEGVGKDASTKIREELSAIADKYAMDEFPFEVTGLSASYTKSFDVNSAAQTLLLKGIPRAEISKASEILDTDAALQVLRKHDLLDDSLFKPAWTPGAVKKALKQFDIDPADFESTRFRAGLTTKKADQDTRKLLESKMNTHIQSFGEEPAVQPSAAARQAPQADFMDIVDELDEDEFQDLRLG